MADAQASGACGRKTVRVQVPLPAFYFRNRFASYVMCRNGGIGRRAGFRCLWSQDCAGSSPASCTLFLFSLKKSHNTKWMRRFGVCIHFVLCVFFLPKYDPSASKVIQKNHQQIGKNLHPEIRPQPQFNRHPHPAHIKKSGQKTTAKESRHFSFQDFPLKGTAVKHKPLIGHKSEENGQNPGCRRGRNRSPVSHPAE